MGSNTINYYWYSNPKSAKADYCIPGEGEWLQSWCYPEYGTVYPISWFATVYIYDKQTGELVFEYISDGVRGCTTADNECYYNLNEDYDIPTLELKDKTTYIIVMNTNSYIRSYMTNRIWVDANSDIEFDTFDEKEYLYYSWRINNPQSTNPGAPDFCPQTFYKLANLAYAGNWQSEQYEYTVDGTNMSSDGTRMRLQTAYYYPFNNQFDPNYDACVNGYAYYLNGQPYYHYDYYGQTIDFDIVVGGCKFTKSPIISWYYSFKQLSRKIPCLISTDKRQIIL